MLTTIHSFSLEARHGRVTGLVVGDDRSVFLTTTAGDRFLHTVEFNTNDAETMVSNVELHPNDDVPARCSVSGLCAGVQVVDDSSSDEEAHLCVGRPSLLF